MNKCCTYVYKTSVVQNLAQHDHGLPRSIAVRNPSRDLFACIILVNDGSQIDLHCVQQRESNDDSHVLPLPALRRKKYILVIVAVVKAVIPRKG